MVKNENLEVKGLTTTTEVIRKEGKVSKLPLTIKKERSQSFL
ncbi:MAG: hypothetical protein ACXABD_21620 [Candidatus Thorarchaeota archaeon]|jgi:hypothetical protein